jgi:hypothetical protein
MPKYRNRFYLYLFFSISIITGVIYIIFSDGFYFIDEGAHYLTNRDVWFNPELSLAPWARFGRAWLYAPAAYLGHRATKVLAYAIFILGLLLVYKTAKKMNFKYPELAMLFLGFQPVFFDLSYSVMSEMPAAVLMLLSFYLYLNKKFASSMLFASLIFLFRYEMMFYTVVLGVCIILDSSVPSLRWNWNDKIGVDSSVPSLRWDWNGRWGGGWKRWIWVTPSIFVGPLIWWLGSVIITGDVMWLWNAFREFSHLAKYRDGAEIYHYIILTPVIFGFLISIFACFGISDKKSFGKKSYWLILLTVIWTYFINILTSVKYLNISGSVGDWRYLSPAAPFVAIFAVAGFNKIFKKYPAIEKKKNIFSFTLILLILVNCFIIAQPHNYNDYEKAVLKLSEKADSVNPQYKILTNNFAMFVKMEVPFKNKDRIDKLNLETLNNLKQGFVIWDPFNCEGKLSYTGFTLDLLRNNNQYKFVDSIEYNNVWLYLVEKKLR